MNSLLSPVLSLCTSIITHPPPTHIHPALCAILIWPIQSWIIKPHLQIISGIYSCETLDSFLLGFNCEPDSVVDEWTLGPRPVPQWYSYPDIHRVQCRAELHSYRPDNSFIFPCNFTPEWWPHDIIIKPGTDSLTLCLRFHHHPLLFFGCGWYSTSKRICSGWTVAFEQNEPTTIFFSMVTK